eukprot:1002949-Amphidinium_carterae.1
MVNGLRRIIPNDRRSTQKSGVWWLADALCQKIKWDASEELGFMRVVRLLESRGSQHVTLLSSCMLASICLGSSQGCPHASSRLGKQFAIADPRRGSRLRVWPSPSGMSSCAPAANLRRCLQRWHLPE